MILKRALKKVIVAGAAGLAYLHIARCELSEIDVESINNYWKNRLSYFEKEIVLRIGLFADFRASNSEALALNSDNLFEKSTEMERRINAMMEELETLRGESSQIIELSSSILGLYKYIDNEGSALDKALTLEARIKDGSKRLTEIIIPSLDISTSLTKKINSYDFHMVEEIEERSGVEKSSLDRLALFKLAKSNKILAANIIYALSSISLSQLMDDAVEEGLITLIHKKIASGFVPKSNVELFVRAVKKDVKNHKINLYISADANFGLLFNIHPMEASDVPLVDSEIMNVYISLLKENLSEEEVIQYTGITSLHVVKLIVIEYIMSARLMDYKSNTVLRNLGKAIENEFDPVEYKISSEELFGIAENIKQDEILNVLTYVWGGYTGKTCLRNMIREVYKDIGIGINEFIAIQCSFEFANWMYDAAMAPLANSDAQYSDSLAVPFDMSYTHPLWYICMRYKHLDDLDNKSGDNYRLFTQINPNTVEIRPHAIKVTDNELVWARYIAECIKACFSPNVDIILRKEDNNKYMPIAYNF
ncbi:hypothetical protein NEMIN01_2452, partial [Nematocida minor]|uniref:uncharacterized protein n=1 Tax=Nematocida minor TaxID=1912983 RepID=UPI00222083BA